MLTYDPRNISIPVYTHLSKLKQESNSDKGEQKSQAVELYTYLATWGLMRLKAEETALTQKGKKELVKCFFKTLEVITEKKLELSEIAKLDASEYLGVTNLALQVAREFAFWAKAIYADVKEVAS
ncbi:MAG: hypothetical protein WCA35_28380 [Kovacikia sp.]